MPRPQPLALIVDDSEDQRVILGGTLEFSGYRVPEAQDGEEALHKAQLLLPDAILMDLKLPKEDGFEATRRIRANPRTKRIPVIAVTAYGSREFEKRAAEVGCTRILQKPVHPHELLVELRKVLED